MLCTLPGISLSIRTPKRAYGQVLAKCAKARRLKESSRYIKACCKVRYFCGNLQKKSDRQGVTHHATVIHTHGIIHSVAFAQNPARSDNPLGRAQHFQEEASWSKRSVEKQILWRTRLKMTLIDPEGTCNSTAKA